LKAAKSGKTKKETQCLADLIPKSLDEVIQQAKSKAQNSSPYRNKHLHRMLSTIWRKLFLCGSSSKGKL